MGQCKSQHLSQLSLPVIIQKKTYQAQTDMLKNNRTKHWGLKFLQQCDSPFPSIPVGVSRGRVIMPGKVLFVTYRFSAAGAAVCLALADSTAHYLCVACTMRGKR